MHKGFTFKGSRSAKVERLVLSRPQTTLAQVASLLAREVPRHEAIACGKVVSARRLRRNRVTGRPCKAHRYPHTNDYLANRGLLTKAVELLHYLMSKGRIQHLRRGVYGPPGLKIHAPSVSA